MASHARRKIGHVTCVDCSSYDGGELLLYGWYRHTRGQYRMLLRWPTQPYARSVPILHGKGVGKR
eukprot:478598-Rhodomonas_salina.1